MTFASLVSTLRRAHFWGSFAVEDPAGVADLAVEDLAGVADLLGSRFGRLSDTSAICCAVAHMSPRTSSASSSSSGSWGSPGSAPMPTPADGDRVTDLRAGAELAEGESRAVG